MHTDASLAQTHLSKRSTAYESSTRHVRRWMETTGGSDLPLASTCTPASLSPLVLMRSFTSTSILSYSSRLEFCNGRRHKYHSMPLSVVSKTNKAIFQTYHGASIVSI